MRLNEDALNNVEQGQQQLKEHIAQNARLIEETQQRVQTSRAFTGIGGVNRQDQGEPEFG